MNSAFRIATRMVMLYEGEFIADGTPEEFRHSSNEVVAQFVEGRTDGPIFDSTKHHRKPKTVHFRDPSAPAGRKSQTRSAMKFERNEISTGLLVVVTVGRFGGSGSAAGGAGIFQAAKPVPDFLR